MTYEAFLAESKRRQEEFITRELRKISRADAAFFQYKCKMADLGLHALTSLEIADRRRQLQDMHKRVDETHGDSPSMRSLYEVRETSNAPSP